MPTISFGETGNDFSQGDFNFDGNVDTTDFNILAGNFGLSLPAAPARADESADKLQNALIPEPVAGAFGLLGLSLIASRRRRGSQAHLH